MAWTELGIENIAFDASGDDTKVCNPPSGANAYIIGGTYYLPEVRAVDLVEMAAGTVTSLQSISGGPDNMSCYLAWGKVNVAGSASTIRRRLTGGDGFSFNEGPTAQIIWLTVDDPNTFARDWKVGTPGSSISFNINSSATDALYCFAGKDGGGGVAQPSDVANWTQRGTTQTVNSDVSAVWRRNSPGATVAVASNPALGFPTLMALSVQNSGGGTPPVFTDQPDDISVTEGASAAFAAVVTGASSYQWKLNKQLQQNVVGVVPLAIGTAQNPAAQAITVPSDATAVLIFGVFGSTGGSASISSFATNFTTTGTLTPTQSSGAGFSAAIAALVGAVNNTSAGRTFTPAFNRTVEIGAHFTFIFLKNINPAAIALDVKVGAAPATSTPATATVVSNTAKAVIGFDAKGGTVPSNPAGWNSLVTDSFNVITPVGLRVRQIITAGDPSTTITSQDSNGSVVAIASINEQGFQNADVGTGATTDTLTINPTTLAMNGWLARLTANNAFGSTDSTPATLSVNPASGPPTLSAPTGAKTGSTTATGGATTDQNNGNRYTVFVTSATPLSAAAIKAGTGAAWASGAVPVSSAGAFSSNATSLAPSTTYYAQSVHTNAAAQDSNVVVSAGFTTDPPAGSPPVVTITSVVVSGQNLTVAGTYTGTVDSAVLNVDVNDPANGATTIGPVAVPYAAGAFSVTVSGVTPGSYLGPEVTMTNTDGSDTDQGGPFEVLGIDGDPDAPGESTQAESAVGAETTNRSLTASRSQAESAAGADSTNRTISFTKSQAESAAGADAATRSMSATRAQAESAAGVDAATATAASTGAQAETSAGVDSSSASITATLSQAESAAAADAQSASVDSIPLSQVESAAPADSTDRQMTATQNQTEAPQALDATSVQMSGVAAQAEGASASDSSDGFRELLASVSESTVPLDANQAFYVSGAFTLELASALDAITGDVSVIMGDQIEAVVVTDEQFAELQRLGLIQEVANAEEATEAMALTATTVFESASAKDVCAILKYPVPTRTGPYAVRRFRISYR